MLLIDELDRADEPFEAFLLEVLSDFQITIPELGTIKAPAPPIVVITSNRTREIHDAVKRRCLYHWVDYPDAARELEILRAPRARRARGAVAADRRLRPGAARDATSSSCPASPRRSTGRARCSRSTPRARPRDGRTTRWACCSSTRTTSPRCRARRRRGSLAEVNERGSSGVGRQRGARWHAAGSGRLAANVMHFARVLRAAGLPVGHGPGARRAARARRRRHRRAATTCTGRSPPASSIAPRAARALRPGVPHLLARPELLERDDGACCCPRSQRTAAPRAEQPESRRLAEALFPRRAAAREARQAHEEQVELEPRSPSPRASCCSSMDFDTMSADDWPQAQRDDRAAAPAAPGGAHAALRARSARGRASTCAPRCAQRCAAAATSSPLDARARRAAPSAAGGAVRHLGLDEPLLAHVPALPARHHQRPRPRARCFVFGTRLTNVTRQLRHRDVDVADRRSVGDGRQGLVGRHAHRRVPARVQLRWSRRVLGQSACVLLISDGLDRDAGEGLARRDGAAAQALPPAHLAEPAAALRGFEPQAGRRARHAAARRRFLAGAQSRKPRGARRVLAQPHDATMEKRARPSCHPAKAGSSIGSHGKLRADDVKRLRHHHANDQPADPARLAAPGLGGAQRPRHAEGLRAGLRVDRPRPARTSTRC